MSVELTDNSKKSLLPYIASYHYIISAEKSELIIDNFFIQIFVAIIVHIGVGLTMSLPLSYNFRMKTKRLIRISYFTMLTIVGGLIKIPVPAFPDMMFTLQTLFVIMSGLLLGAKDGAFSQIAYMLLGLVGVPIFTKGGGPSYVLQPSFGYIAAFPIGAFITGLLKRRFRTLSVLKLFFCAFFGLVGIYAIGVPYQFLIIWLYLQRGALAAAATLTTLPFMFIIDSILLYIACLLYPKINTLIGIADPPFEKKKNETDAGIAADGE